MKKFGYFLLVLFSIMGIWGVMTVFVKGHIEMNTTQHIPWGLWVALYTFFLGLSTGSFLLSTLYYVFGVKHLKPVASFALLQALGCLFLGGILIVLDIGHPFRIYKVFISFNPSSVLSWKGLFYFIYVPLILSMGYFGIRPALIRNIKDNKGPIGLYRWLSMGSTELTPESFERDSRWLKRLGLIGIPLALFILGGEGATLAVAKARPTWFSGLYPILILVSSLASGGALLTLLSAAFIKETDGPKLDLVRYLARLTIGFLAFEAFIIASEILVTFYGYIPVEVEGWRLALFGPFWWVFWIIQLGLGTLIPLWIVLSRRSTSVRWLGFAGILVILGAAGTRMNIIIPPLINPVFESIPESYHHFRNSVGYFPSIQEWFVAAFVFALGTWLFIGALKVLPLESAGGESR
jgi:molybdopterin-containing oxidoreductase family membrane subunit